MNRSAPTDRAIGPGDSDSSRHVDGTPRQCEYDVNRTARFARNALDRVRRRVEDVFYHTFIVDDNMSNFLR